MMSYKLLIHDQILLILSPALSSSAGYCPFVLSVEANAVVVIMSN